MVSNTTRPRPGCWMVWEVMVSFLFGVVMYKDGFLPCLFVRRTPYGFNKPKARALSWIGAMPGGGKVHFTSRTPPHLSMALSQRRARVKKPPHRATPTAAAPLTPPRRRA
jgi:hypothetical protein